MGIPEIITADIGILGGGPAGYVGAVRAAQLGAHVVVVEEREIGGVCLNRGCIPTKTLLKNAETVLSVKKSKEMGIDTSGFQLDWGAAQSRKDRVVKNLRLGLEHLLAGNKVEIIKGRGIIQNPNRVSAETSQGQVLIDCKKILITTGSEPAIPDILGDNFDGVISSDQALELSSIPENMVILGAGAIGLEFATIFALAGSKVTVIEMSDRILPYEDREVTTELLKIMKRQGIGFKLSSTVKEIKDTGGHLEVCVAEKNKETILAADKVLLAVGRTLRGVSPDVANLGVKTNNGAIVVNEKMETSVKGVYAAGDVIGNKLLAHLAYAEGRVAVENALGLEAELNYETVPACVYTHPEVASVGLNEDEAKVRGIPVKTGRFDFRHNGRALSINEREGFVKVLVHCDTGMILGGQILGCNASELISELTLAITLSVKAETLAQMIHPHPTLSEAIMEACADAAGCPVHKL